MGSSIIIGNNNIQGRNVSIINGKVFIDGKLIDLPENEKTINIQAENLETLQVDNCNEITVNGNADNIKIGQCSLSIGGEVKGNVKVSQGNVSCGNIGGDTSVSMGNIHCTK